MTGPEIIWIDPLGITQGHADCLEDTREGDVKYRRHDLPRPEDLARIARLESALRRIITPAPAVSETPPPWVVGVARAALENSHD